MSKVLPAKYETEGNCDNVCPRYKKWINRTTNDGACRQPEKVGANKSSSSHTSRYNLNLFSHRSSKRKRNKSKRRSNSECSPNGKSKEKPLRSKSIFFRIRQKGRNFGIRCKTSVELWRKWIKRGIHWDRSPPKPADIDIITKPENKLKEFSKKSIINEVILEEDEDDTNSIVSRPKDTEIKTAQTKPQPDEIKLNEDKSPERNFLGEIPYIQRASNLFISSKKNNETAAEPQEMVIGNSDERQQSSNGQAKYPMEDLSRMDIGRIEKLEYSEEKLNGSQERGTSRGNSCRSKAPPARGTIHRAYNKLKLFF